MEVSFVSVREACCLQILEKQRRLPEAFCFPPPKPVWRCDAFALGHLRLGPTVTRHVLREDHYPDVRTNVRAALEVDQLADDKVNCVVDASMRIVIANARFKRAVFKHDYRCR